MTYDNSNVFARILRGEIPCQKVLETDHGLAFHDVRPAAPVHVLVIPKGPYTDALDFYSHGSDDEIAGFGRFLSQVLAILNIAEGGYRLIANHGLNGGQEVPHFHLHILAGKPLGAMLTGR